MPQKDGDEIKPHGYEIVSMLSSLSEACGGALPGIYKKFEAKTGFQHVHMRELEIYQNLRSEIMPEIFGVYAGHENKVYIILMEYLEDVDLLNSVMETEKWTDLHIKEALKSIAQWHALHPENKVTLNKDFWPDKPGRNYMMELMPVWEALLQNIAEKHASWYSPERIAKMKEIIQNIPTYWSELEMLPKVLVHNDMNPRNACFKTVNGGVKICLYDWELATFHVPQYDVVEFLCFVLKDDKYASRLEYMDFYREEYQKASGSFIDSLSFFRGCQLAAYDFGVHRLGMYLMAHAIVPYAFLPAVVDSYFNTLEQLNHYLERGFSYSV